MMPDLHGAQDPVYRGAGTGVVERVSGVLNGIQCIARWWNAVWLYSCVHMLLNIQ